VAKPVAARGFARERVLTAALELFAEHGVHGTSVQMIADRIGVGKAAVYNQFHAKEDLAFEAARPLLDDMDRVVRTAEAFADGPERQSVALAGLVEMAVRHRRLTAVFYSDPGIAQALHDRPESRSVAAEFRHLIEGPNATPRSRIAISLLLAGIHVSVGDPELDDIDEADLRAELLDVAQRILRSSNEGG
jgi:AcrR family transcriptional regulator